jgi:acyl-CoA synthetase (AMP-forming)/AMP-acid ligase II
MHLDHYVEIRDRAKDVIISGGENISSLEIEGVLYRCIFWPIPITDSGLIRSPILELCDH